MGERSKGFYFLRLKKASTPELVYRAKQVLLGLRLKILLRKNRNLVQVPIIGPLDVESLKLPSFQHQVSEDIVEEIVRGQIFSLNEDRIILRTFEEEVRHIFFANIKKTNSLPDLRTVWEPARLQHIALLIVYTLQETALPDSNAIKKFAHDAVVKWVNQNPFLFGPHYISAMECGLRIPVFFYCLKSLNEMFSHEYRLVLDTIYLHAWWISRRLSLYSSLGNHTIAECVGLIFAGAVFRKTREGQHWLEKGYSHLNKELNHQILEDGGPAEQSLNYHRLILDLYWLSVDFLEKNNLYDCSDIKLRLIRGEDFLNAFQDLSGSMPSIGDSDDGHAIAPGVYPKRIKDNKKRRYYSFAESGYTVIKVRNSAYLTFDHGPLGMAPLYNHGHADALSITLSKDNEKILVDPGTYRYNGATEFRKYFKGTRAHNTVTIDELDQAVQETSFIWSKPYKAKLTKATEKNDRLLIEAFHDGYSRLKRSVCHKRSILYFEEANFLIKDTFWGNGIHSFELNYHLHPEASLTKSHDWWLVDNQGAKVFIRLLNEYDFVIVKGQESPLLGWCSPSYGIKKKSSVLHCTIRGFTHEVSFVTAICTEAPVEVKDLHEIASTFI